MKQLTILTGGLVLFGAGILAGHYGTVTITTDLSKTEVNSRAISSPVTPQSQSAPPNLVTSPMKSSSAGPDSSGVPLPPHEFVLTAEMQAQLKAQQEEAIQAQIAQLEEMIQSMKENGLPEEDIKAFTEMKRAVEQQQIAEPEPSNANQPEPTVEEIKNDFAESLEQAGMPAAEREGMIENLFSSIKLTNQSAGDLNVEPSPPLR